MANINELEWATVEGSDYPVATTVIGDVNINITKLDEDSYIVTNGENGQEINLSQLEELIATNVIAWNVNDSTPTDGGIIVDEIPEELTLWSTESIWKNVKGVGKKVLEIPHLHIENGVLRIIKLDDDSYKIAVLGVPPNDTSDIIYQEVDAHAALINYSYAAGHGIYQAERYYEKLKADAEPDVETPEYETIYANLNAESESTDYETIEE